MEMSVALDLMSLARCCKARGVVCCVVDPITARIREASQFVVFFAPYSKRHHDNGYDRNPI